MIITVATDGGEMYTSEREQRIAGRIGHDVDERTAAHIFAENLDDTDAQALLELSDRDRRRIFNLGYFTWVEQQGIDLASFDARRDQQFWRSIRSFLDECDERIVELNERTGVLADLT